MTRLIDGDRVGESLPAGARHPLTPRTTLAASAIACVAVTAWFMLPWIRDEGYPLTMLAWMALPPLVPLLAVRRPRLFLGLALLSVAYHLVAAFFVMHWIPAAFIVLAAAIAPGRVISAAAPPPAGGGGGE